MQLQVAHHKEVEMVSKRREQSEEQRADALAPRLRSLDGQRLGLLSTGKRNCDALLAEIGALVGQRHRLTAVRSWSKPSVYRLSPIRRLEEIAAQCDAVVAGLGD